MARVGRSLRLHAIAVSIISALLLLVGVGTVSSASADSYKQGAAPVAASAVAPALQGVGPTTITCTAIANDPHPSKHVGGTVNFVGSIKCTAPVASLRMTLTLSFDGYPVASKTNGNAGQASLSNNVAAACSSGGWQGSTVGTVVFPPGYVPQSGTVSASKEASITC